MSNVTQYASTNPDARAFLQWERCAEGLHRHAKEATNNNVAFELENRAVTFDRLIAEVPAESLADVMVKVRLLGRVHAPSDRPSPTPYSQPAILTILAALDRMRG